MGTRGSEFRCYTECNKQENNKTSFPNEEGQDEWGTQQERKSRGEWSWELDPEYDMRSGDITGVTGVLELTWCYNCNTRSVPLSSYPDRGFVIPPWAYSFPSPRCNPA